MVGGGKAPPRPPCSAKTKTKTKTAPKGWFAFSLAPRGKVPADCAAMCPAWKKKQGISSRDWCTSSND